uniref:Uncharacterized protein n=1 Tax=uncultured Thiotrichaceae bacterium TaxID=298394 RepID=A0A6S6UDY5_9GAMM|nr:MAG: Unknown protein [uncultured Thiotrichaceae bacterium]
MQRVVLELKILYSNLDKTIADGLVQVAGYAEQCGAEEAHLIVFNRDDAVGWDDKIWYQDGHVVGELAVGVWGC